MKRVSGIYSHHYFRESIKFDLLKSEVLLKDYSNNYSAFHNYSIIKMNGDFLELIDQRYAWLGKTLGFLFFFIFVMFPIIYVVYLVFNHSGFKENAYFITYILTVIFGISCLFLYLVFKNDYKNKICHPILFNRNNQKVYFYINEYEYIEKHWKDVIWVMSPSDGAGGAPIYEIQAHIVEDGIVKKTFLVGYPVLEKKKNYGLWNFICHYMEHGPEQLYAAKNRVYSQGDLKTKLSYCHRLVGAKESYKDTWQAMRNIYKGNFFFIVGTFPLDLFYFMGRRILLNILPIPIWPEQVRAEIEYDKLRPEQVDYKDNY